MAVTPSAPAIFATPGYGVTTPLNSDGTANSPANPAKLGTYMTIFVTGAGLFQGDLGTGAIAPLAPLFSTQLPVSVQIFSGNNPVHQATVLYAGLRTHPIRRHRADQFRAARCPGPAEQPNRLLNRPDRNLAKPAGSDQRDELTTKTKSPHPRALEGWE